jgi:hypothetical protein
MTRSVNKRFAAAALTAAAVTIWVPVAQAQSPDAFERAVQSRQPSPTVLRIPDAIDRAVAAREARKAQAAIDARERALTERPAPSATPGPDAFERALVTHTDAVRMQTASMLDGRERALAVRSATPTQVAGADGFDWGDFGVGAGAGIGGALMLLGLGAGVLAIRRSDERVTTA